MKRILLVFVAVSLLAMAVYSQGLNRPNQSEFLALFFFVLTFLYSFFEQDQFLDRIAARSARRFGARAERTRSVVDLGYANEALQMYISFPCVYVFYCVYTGCRSLRQSWMGFIVSFIRHASLPA